ncbi:polysaccharide biosynthesis tyrosine autokinase [soil metagenome]
MLEFGNLQGAKRGAVSDARSKGQVLDIHRLVEIIRRRYRLFLAVAFLVLAAVTALTFLLTPRYSAEAMLKVDPVIQRRSDLGSSVDSSQPDSALVDTEVAIIRSREVSEAVINRLHLLKDPEFIHGNATQLPQKEKLERVAEEIDDRLGIARQGLTYIIGVSFQSSDPQKAARIANAVAEQYLAVSRNLRGGAAEERAEALKAQVAGLSKQVQDSDEEIAHFRAATGTVSGGETIGTATDRLVLGIAQELSTAQSAAAEARARAGTARAQAKGASIDSVSQVLSSPTISDLRRQQATLIQQRADAAARLGMAHPAMTRINDELASVNKELASEADRIVAGLEADAVSADSRAANLRMQLSRLRGMQGTDASAIARVDTMQRQADGTRAVYNQLNQSMQEAREQAQVSGAQARIVSAAVAPVKPAFPNKTLFLAFGSVLAGVTGLGAALVAEAMRKGIRSGPELEERLNIKVLGSLVELSPRRLASANVVDLDRPFDYVLARPASIYAETLRGVRSELTKPDGQGGRVLTVTSAMTAEGKTTTAISLARIMAISGDKVLLIDGDARRMTLSNAITPSAQADLLDVLQGRLSFDEVVMVDAEGMAILPMLEHDFTPKDLFGDGKLKDLLDVAKTKYDWIIIDAPPVLSVTDARQLARMADQVVIVVRWEQTPADAVQKALDMIGANVTRHLDVGCIINRVVFNNALNYVDPAYYGHTGAYHFD